LDSAWIPWAKDKISPGDTVFPVGIEDGQLLLIAKVVADRVLPSDPATEELTVYSKLGEASAMRFDRIVPSSIVSRLRYVDANGDEHGFRRERGRLIGQTFQGRASVRRLTPSSGKLLESRLGTEPAEIADLKAAAKEAVEGTRVRRRLSVQERDAIEERALEVAKSHYRHAGWHLAGEYRTGPFDLRFTKGRRQLFVEVKGTQSDGFVVPLTAGEVEHARRHQGESCLFVVAGIVLSKRRGKTAGKGGTHREVTLWSPQDADLTAVSYTYRVP
jgi:hypothetical protein